MTNEQLEAIRARLAAARKDAELTKMRYDHGGGRAYVDGTSRHLIIDCYDEANREFYFNAAVDMEALLDEITRLNGLVVSK